MNEKNDKGLYLNFDEYIRLGEPSQPEIRMEYGYWASGGGWIENVGVSERFGS